MIVEKVWSAIEPLTAGLIAKGLAAINCSAVSLTAFIAHSRSSVLKLRLVVLSLISGFIDKEINSASSCRSNRRTHTATGPWP